MNTVFVILTVLVILAAILLIIVVLLQNGKGGGMASNFVAGNQTFGVRQTADLLEKVTYFLISADNRIKFSICRSLVEVYGILA